MLFRRPSRAIKAWVDRRYRRFKRDQRGTVAIISAIAIPALIGMTGLVAELGHGLLTKAENQRVADLAAFAGALAYNATSSETTMSAAAKAVANMNGIASTAVTATLTTSPRDATNQAVYVRIATSNLVLLAPVTKTTSVLAIGANAYAQLGAQTPACILALSGSGSGVTLSGGTSVTASACAVASNTTVSVPCGTHISTKMLTYASSYSQGCAGGITANSINRATTVDPFATNTTVSTANTRIATVAAVTSPAAPATPTVTSTRDLAFDWSNTGSTSATMTNATAVGCTSTWNSSNNTFTLTCPSGGTYNFQNLYLGGGISVNFNTAGTAATTYNFSGCIANTGVSLAFGPGTYNVVRGIATGGGTTTTFGAGTFNIGASTSACNSVPSYPSWVCSAGYSVCNTGTTLTFAGPSTFNLSGGLLTTGSSLLAMGKGTTNTFRVGSATAACNSAGVYSLCNLSSGTTDLGSASASASSPSTFSFSAGIYNNGGSTLKMGAGATNTFAVGKSSDGNALYVGGGSNTTFADATSGTTSFQMNGNVANGGGSCTTFSAATQHDINGSISMMGGTILGTGVYTVNGYFALGANAGGAVTCNGVSVGMSGTGVTLVISGSTAPTSGTCNAISFCIASGFSNVSLIAPTSGTYGGFAVIGPINTSRTSGALLAQGASGVSVSGAFYYPNGPISLSGGASIGNGAGQCLQLIGTQVTLSGGTTAASSCVTAAGASSTNVALVQ